MDPFDEWAKASVQHPCIRKWSDRLIELGASWDSFRRDPCDIVQDLVNGGIPLLAARDIVDIASSAVKRSYAPMAIFWDLENMPIPSASSGRDVASRLKSILAPHGDLVQFRGYASIGLGLIPQQKRSDLQLSCCHLVDCPHNGRKEVADKMIIVDAMQFAFSRPEGATLCFVTGDVDYAYLLAVLQRPQWRTIVISKGTMQSMLHVNCDMKMRWETDILQLRPGLPPGFEGVAPAVVEADASTPTGTATVTYKDVAILSSEQVTMDREGALLNETAPFFETLTPDEEWADDVVLLRTIIKTTGSRCGGQCSVLKSLVGTTLRQTNPARFPHREAIQSFLVQAIQRGVVVETGEGATKVLCLSMDGNQNNFFPAVSLSELAPMDVHAAPEKVREVGFNTRPYVLFVPWSRCPKENKFPSRAFVQSANKWAILMFRSLTDAQRTVKDLPWLRFGTLVDWRRVEEGKRCVNASPINDASQIPLVDAGKLVDCCRCNAASQASTEMIRGNNGEDLCYCCPQCYILNDKERENAVQWVVSLMGTMAENDDIYIAESILRKQLHCRHQVECTSRKHAGVWIDEAARVGAVVAFKRPNNKTRLVCLPSHYKDANGPFPPDSMDTSLEEAHVLDLLWANNGWRARVDVIQSLKGNFASMQTPLLRTKVFLNAFGKGLFFLAKGTSGHTVGLTLEDASAALKLAFSSSDETRSTTTQSDSMEDTETTDAS